MLMHSNRNLRWFGYSILYATISPSVRYDISLPFNLRFHSIVRRLPFNLIFRFHEYFIGTLVDKINMLWSIASLMWMVIKYKTQKCCLNNAKHVYLAKQRLTSIWLERVRVRAQVYTTRARSRSRSFSQPNRRRCISKYVFFSVLLAF